MIADRFTKPEDVEWFDQALVKLVEEELGEECKNIVDCGLDRYFVDFLRDAPEATGTDQSLRHAIEAFYQCSCAVSKQISESCPHIISSMMFSSQEKSQKILTLICPRCMSQWSHLRV